MAASIALGTDLEAGEAASLLLRALAMTHALIIGGSGSGKSRLMLALWRCLARLPFLTVLLDGKNDTADDAIRWSALFGETPLVIDPDRQRWSAPLNCLAPIGDATPAAQAQLVLEAMKKLFGEADEYKAWLEEWAPPSLIPLIQAGFTMTEVFGFVSIQDPRFRDALLAQLDDPFLVEKWRELEAFPPKDRSLILNVLRTRASAFHLPPLKDMFGQQATIDWLRLMDEGGLVIARLGDTNRVTARATEFIGATILHQVQLAAEARAGSVPEGARRSVFLFCDEFGRFATPAFADALMRLRGLGVHLVLACQSLGQLRRKAPAVYDETMANCKIKCVFSVSREDADILAPELWSGHIDGERIKDEIYRTGFRPVESTRVTRTRGQGWSASRERAESRQESVGWSAALAAGRSASRGRTRGRTASTTEARTETASAERTRGRALSRAETRSRTASKTQSSSHTAGHAVSTGTSEGHSVVTGSVRTTATQESRSTATTTDPEGNVLSETESVAEAMTTTLSESRVEVDGQTTSEGEAWSEADTAGRSRTVGQGRAHTRGEATSEATARGRARSRGRTHGRATTLTDSRATETSRTRTRSRSRSRALGSSASSGRTRSGTMAESVGPWLEQHPYKELGNRTFYSLEEERERVAAALAGQPQRHFHLKLFAARPRPIATRDVPLAPGQADQVEQALEQWAQRHRLPAPQAVDPEIRERIPKYLAEAAPPKALSFRQRRTAKEPPPEEAPVSPPPKPPKGAAKRRKAPKQEST